MSNWEKLQAKLKAKQQQGPPPSVAPGASAASSASATASLGSAAAKALVKGNTGAGAGLGNGATSSQKQGGKGKKRRRWDLSEAAQREAAERQAQAEKEGKLRRVEAEGGSVSVPDKERYLGLDCEMVGVGDGGKRSALARVTLVDFDGRVVYDEHVRPVERVTDFRTWVSGVKVKHLKEAISLKECIRQVGELVRGKILVGHALQNDLQALLLQHPVAAIRDTARYRAYMRPHGRDGGKLRPRRLKDLAAEVLGLEIQEGKHDSGEDARAAMLLYRARREEWEKEIRKKGHRYRITSGVSTKAIAALSASSTPSGAAVTAVAVRQQQVQRTTTVTTTVAVKRKRA